jgi:guanylate kinase
MADKGNLYIIAAPSGTGKTTLVKALTDAIPNLTVSISHTTRAPRPNEVHGVNYYFIDKAEFQTLIDHQDFLEHAVIFDQYYGTSKAYVNQTLHDGLDVILEIEWQGHQQIRHLFPEAISIFILPPSLEDLNKRLNHRNQDNAKIILNRLADAKTMVSHIQEFDYIVINDDFDQALLDLKSIIHTGRLTFARQSHTFAGIITALTSV